MRSSVEVTIEKITKDDMLDLLPLEQEFYAEGDNHNGSINYDENVVESRILSYIESPDHVAFKAVIDGEIVGYFYAFQTQLEMSSTPIGWESLFFVTKKARGTKAIYELFEAFFDWCKSRNIKHVWCVVSHSKNDSGAYAVCEKMQMKERGKVFERVL